MKLCNWEMFYLNQFTALRSHLKTQKLLIFFHKTISRSRWCRHPLLENDFHVQVKCYNVVSFLLDRTTNSLGPGKKWATLTNHLCSSVIIINPWFFYSNQPLIVCSKTSLDLSHELTHGCESSLVNWIYLVPYRRNANIDNIKNMLKFCC
jgi:hypothetical protein